MSVLGEKLESHIMGGSKGRKNCSCYETTPSISITCPTTLPHNISRNVATWLKPLGLLFGRPQTCVYPNVCLGIGKVSGKAILLGQGVWQIHKESVLLALQIPWDEEEGRGVSTRYLIREGGLYQIQCQSPSTHGCKHRGCPSCWCVGCLRVI